MSNRFVDEDLDWLVEVKPSKQRGGHDVDYIKDPVTGKFEGSRPGTGGGEAGAVKVEGGNPEATDVGGDQWNKDTAKRLEAEYVAAKPELEKIVADAVGEKAAVELESEGPDPEDAPFVPDEWASMSNDQQQEAEDEYMKDTYDDYMQGEIDNWYDQDAPHQAREKVTEDFNDDTEYDWASAAVDTFMQRWEDNGHPVPFTHEQILNAITLDYTGDYGSPGDPDFTIDDEALGLPIGWQAGQQTLPGIEAQKPEDLLTEQMRNGLIKDLEKAFEKEADRVVQKMDPPDYLGDSVKEYQEM